MAIAPADGVTVVTVGQALGMEGLSVPRYQRPYSWRPATALQLLDDVHASWRDRKGSYLLGAVILHQHDDQLDLVDGQQRLITLLMLSDLLRGNVDGTLQPGEDADSPAVVVRSALHRRLAQLTADREALADYVQDSCWLICVQTDDEDEAFRVFDSQNYRGKALMPHDLLKAYHLREMHERESATAQQAVVEAWEGVPEADLDRLFSSYLYRIQRWSRGLPASRFTAADIGLFKGVRSEHRELPLARYHRAAQTVVPLLLGWEAEPPRGALHARFQLDAPVTPGRPFFELVEFVHEELKRLRKDFYDGATEAYAAADEDLQPLSGRSRFRYVAETYLAAALYYTNKFGDAETDEARQRLFRWAYALRVRRQRVQFLAVDRLAREEGSAFRVIRDAASPTDLRVLATEPLDALPGQDPALADLLTRLESA